MSAHPGRPPRGADRAPLARRMAADDGMALISVIGMTVVLTAFMVVAVVTGIDALRSSHEHVSFEQSLSVAEAGVDATFAILNEQYNAGNPGWTNPSPCALPSSSASDTASATAERAWATSRLEALPTSCTVTTPQGQYVAGRAPGRQAVYSMGWSPSRSAAEAESRLIKAEYVFAPFAPSQAVLTDSDLDLGGSVVVDHINPANPASVHTNGTITRMNASLNVTGTITATGGISGSCPSNVLLGCAPAAPTQSIPNVSPRAVYGQYAATEPNWFDLCPDGTVRAPSVVAGVAGMPCTGALLAGGIWEWDDPGGVSTWTYPRGSTNAPGVYYVYQGNAELGSNGSSTDERNITVLAESVPTGGPATSCGKLGGNIEWKLFTLRPYLSSLVVMAQGNISGGANADAGPGLFLAGDRVHLQTSSATVTGAVIAANTCAAAGSNEIQGVTIHHDQTIEAPVNDIIRTSLWLEYGG